MWGLCKNGSANLDSNTAQEKNYYNDKHESPSNINYRHEFIKRYFDYELHAQRWIQLPIEEYNGMVQRGEVFSGKGYQYFNESNKPFIEFHIDDHPSFSNNKRCHCFGGNL